jgi:hypothetical protein
MGKTRNASLMASFQIALLMEYLGNTFQRVIADGDLSHFYFFVSFFARLFLRMAICHGCCMPGQQQRSAAAGHQWMLTGT